MIKKLKEDETEYVRKCSKCASIFTYNKIDYCGGYGRDSNYVRCPVCDHHQHIYFHKVYKRDEEVQEDYKKLIRQLEQEKINFRNTITNKCCEIDSLKRENEKMKSNVDYENVRLKNSIERLEKEKLKVNDMLDTCRENLTKVCQEKMELEDELEELKNIIDKLGITIEKNEHKEEQITEPIEDIVEPPKKKSSRKNGKNVKDKR